jgi:hypothetical protein
MTQTRFTCTLTQADEPACQSYARVTIIDVQGDSGPGMSSPRCGRPRRHLPRPR